MNARFPTQLTTSSGAPLPLTGLPQAARRIGPVGYIRGNGADVIGS